MPNKRKLIDLVEIGSKGGRARAVKLSANELQESGRSANMWVLGGEFITELNYMPSLRKAPLEKVLADLIKDGGPILHHGDSEEQQRSFESTCRKLWKFLNQSQG
jgi:hypothetical protein